MIRIVAWLLWFATGRVVVGLAKTALLLAAVGVCCSHCVGPARAESVTPSLICRVQSAIKHRSPAWSEQRCVDVSAAIADTARPRTTLAMAIWESDLRPDVAVEARPGVFDAGLLGVRCVLYPGTGVTARGYGPRSAAAGRCQNGPARGYTLEQLKDPVINVRVAAEIMAEKRARHGQGWLRAYNGATTENGYGENIRVIAAALAGVRLPSKSARARKLIAQILAAVAPRIARAR